MAIKKPIPAEVFEKYALECADRDCLEVPEEASDRTVMLALCSGPGMVKRFAQRAKQRIYIRRDR